MDYKELAKALDVYVDIDCSFFKTSVDNYKNERYGTNEAINLTYRDFIINDIRQIRVLAIKVYELEERIKNLENKGN